MSSVKKIGTRSLKITHPKIAKMADGWDPTEFTAGSGVRKNWKCQKSHKWTQKIQAVVVGVGCPYCGRTKVLAGFNDLKTTHPLIAKESDGWDPTEVMAGSHKKVSWKCSKGHVWQTTIGLRTSTNSTCPICSNRIVETGFNDLLTKYPDLAKEADGWDPSKVLSGTHKKFKWKCKKGHNWEASVASRISMKTHCAVCAGKKCIKGINDLATTNPTLAKQAFGWDPSTVTQGSKKRRKWICSKKHIWEAEVGSRSSGRGCPACRGFSIVVGKNDLATINPLIAAQAYGWDPKQVTAGSAKRMEWICTEGHIWKTSVVNRFQGNRSNGSDCPICTGKKLLVGFNDLEKVYPEIAKEADGWDPKKIFHGTHKKLQWKCSLGHIYKTTVVLRTRNKTGCPICAGNKVLVGFNDLKTINPQLASQATDIDPETLTIGSNKQVTWKCDSGHLWKASPSTRKVSGCPTCAKTGFDPNEPGWLYLIRQEQLQLLQIGITNNLKTRLANHRTRRWELVDAIGPMDGMTARNWEKSILGFLQQKGVLMASETKIEHFEGYTESWVAKTFETTSIKDLMNQIRSEEWEQ